VVVTHVLALGEHTSPHEWVKGSICKCAEWNAVLGLEFTAELLLNFLDSDSLCLMGGPVCTLGPLPTALDTPLLPLRPPNPWGPSFSKR
jgi:hypothetical protein